MSSEKPAAVPPHGRVLMPGKNVTAVGLLVLAGIGLLAVVALVGWEWKTSSALKRELVAIHAAGYPVTGAELDAWYPHVPDDQNAAPGILAASASLKFPKDWSWNLSLSSVKPAGLSDHMNPARRRAIDRVLRDNAGAMDAVRAAVRLPKARYPIDLSRGRPLHLDYLGKLREMTDLFTARAVAAAEDGQADRATDAVLTSLKLARTLDDDPMVLSQLVRGTIQRRGLAAFQRAINLMRFNTRDLERISNALESAHRPEGLVRAFAGERVVNDMAAQEAPPEGSNWRFVVPWSSIVDWNRLLLLQVTTEAVKASSLPGLQRRRRFKQIWDAGPTLPLKRIDLIAAELYPNFTMIGEADLITDATIQASRAGVIVCLWRQRGGVLPGDFGGFPEGIRKQWPTDPFTGGPIRYLKQPRGFVVYSVGPDGVDQGGGPLTLYRGDRCGDIPFRVDR